MKKIILSSILLSGITFSALSCIENPNVTEDVYLSTPNSTKSWIVGLKRQLALTTNAVTINVEIASDNYFNNYTQYTKVFDRLQIDYFDPDVNTLQAQILALREMAEYGITKVAVADATTTNAEKASMYFYRAYANLLGGELFVGLPGSSLGPVANSKELLQRAIGDLDQAIALETDANNILKYKLLKARTYYGLGDAANAKLMSNEIITQSANFLTQITFDGQNGAGNEIQNGTFDALPNRLAPLPRLDFLDPKYYYQGTIATDQKPVTLAKSEEAYLILAEALLSEGNITGAKTQLQTLIQTVVPGRITASVSDKGENRNGGNRKDYPLKAVGVRFDASGPVKQGHVLDRQAGNITVKRVSGTSVVMADLTAAITQDQVLYLIYLMRQEIFFAEGRRLTDLGIKFPISQIESDNNSNVTAEYKKALIPSFIPANGAYDDFTTEAGTGVVTMKHDMNKVIINNKTSKDIVPFF